MASDRHARNAIAKARGATADATGDAAHRPRAAGLGARPPTVPRAAAWIAGRELRLLTRSGIWWALLAALAVVAWLPPLLVPLRSGSVALAPFRESVLLSMALGSVALPLLALLLGAEMIAGEIEDRTLAPMLTLPISRSAFFLGKALGRGAAFATAYAAAFGSLGAALVATHGLDGTGDLGAVAAAGLLLSTTAAGLGSAIGVRARSRLRALGGALVAWLFVVFLLDAALLIGVVALAPPPPAQVGVHGHTELAAPEADGPRLGAPALLALSPLGLYRLAAITASPALRARLRADPTSRPLGLAALSSAWALWIAAPPLFGLRRFRRAPLL